MRESLVFLIYNKFCNYTDSLEESSTESPGDSTNDLCGFEGLELVVRRLEFTLEKEKLSGKVEKI